MFDRFVLFILLPLAAMLVSIGYTLVSSYRLRDLRPVLFVVVLGLMSVHQTNELLLYLDTGSADAVAGFGEYPETLANLTASVAVVLILRLVAKQRAMSEQLEAQIDRERQLRRENERLDKFASVISHDIRNPLQVAQGRLDLALRETDDENLVQAADSLARIEALMEETLELARKGQTVTDPEPVDIESVATDSREMVATDSLTVDVVDEFTVLGDPERLQQLLENLFANAAEHGSPSPASRTQHDAVDYGVADEERTDGGDPSVTVRIGRLDDGFYVEDDGPGIPESERESVTEPGYTTTDDGTGFGLAIVDEIADAHGWELTISDGADGGARFAFHGAETHSD